MSLLSGDFFRKKHSYQSQRRGETLLTPGFFRFLLAFTVIIALSFGALFFLGITTS